jgi:DNA-binding NarL/FixJ family response regulator
MESHFPATSPLTTALTILIVDDHEATLHGILNIMQNAYPHAKIITSKNASEAQEIANKNSIDLAILDIHIPEKPEGTGDLKTGLKLIKTLMEHYSNLNFVVQSGSIDSLVQLLPEIRKHNSGFTIHDKAMSNQEFLKNVGWALQGTIYTPREMRSQGIELKPEWLELLNLGIEEALQDKQIAIRMNISESTVRGYWKQIQDALEIYPDADKGIYNTRMLTAKRARELNLI